MSELFIADIRKLLATEFSLYEVSDVLRKHKNCGMSQSDAISILKSMRSDNETEDDKILEVLDIAAGWCQPRYDVW